VLRCCCTGASAGSWPCRQRFQCRRAGPQSQYSSYHAPQGGADAFSSGRAKPCPTHITFTNIHMPLVKTPMIVPSQLNGAADQPERAAAWWCAASSTKPPRNRYANGHACRGRHYSQPKLSGEFCISCIWATPDSAAARGIRPRPSDTSRRPRRVRRPSAGRRVARIGGSATRAQSDPLVPGVQLVTVRFHRVNATGPAPVSSTSTPRRRCAGLDIPTGQP